MTLEKDVFDARINNIIRMLLNEINGKSHQLRKTAQPIDKMWIFE